jgi:phenylalanyl-tRNA synthetase beta chain
MFFELNLNVLIKFFGKITTYKQLNTYPKSYRDLAFILPKNTEWVKVKKEVEKTTPFLTDVSLFDFYEGVGISEDEKSIAFHLTFEDSTKTLEQGLIDELIQKIIELVRVKFGGKIR